MTQVRKRFDALCGRNEWLRNRIGCLDRELEGQSEFDQAKHRAYRKKLAAERERVTTRIWHSLTPEFRAEAHRRVFEAAQKYAKKHPKNVYRTAPCLPAGRGT